MTRILVADDDPASTELLTYFLESKGFEVETAPDGNRALEMGTSGDFELVILDVHMPMYDGVELLELLRKRYILHPIKVIALTGDLSRDLRDALARGGIDSFLTKPVDLGLLHEEVRRLMVAQAAVVMVTPEAEEAPAAGVTPWVLLLVQDEDRRRRLLRQLENAGFGVEIASNAREAIACLKVMTPALVMIEDRVYTPVGR